MIIAKLRRSSRREGHIVLIKGDLWQAHLYRVEEARARGNRASSLCLSRGCQLPQAPLLRSGFPEFDAWTSCRGRPEYAVVAIGTQLDEGACIPPGWGQVRTIVTRLRQKLANATHIFTERRVGYMVAKTETTERETKTPE